MRVFLSVAAQQENLGDLVLRRTTAEWLDQLGVTTHIFVGQMPEQYLRALRLSPHTAYKSLARWTCDIVWWSLCGRVSVVFAPGPQFMMLERRELLRSITNLALCVIVRSSRGSVIKLGRSYHGNSKLMKRIERLIFKLSTLYLPRENSAREFLPGTVTTIPDLAVAPAVGAERRSDRRYYVALSWRHDREVPLDLMDYVVALCKNVELTPILVTQVWTDHEGHEALAKKYALRHLGWTDRCHPKQLEDVNAIYSRSAAVITNRLHAAIFGWNNGAVPLGFSDERDQKIRSHFAVLNLADYVIGPLDQDRLAFLKDEGSRSAAMALTEIIHKDAVHRLESVRKSVEEELT